ncbi:MAG: hypothetical protein JNM93_13475 [Bacteriovoracaceae bacterium]|nr:hypothetical protein [Bacteriovoracaceae bacterium]
MKYLFLLFFYSVSAFSFFMEDAEVNEQMYKRYVRPQVKSIIVDFYSAIKGFEGAQADLANAIKNLSETKEQLYELAAECPTYIEEKCSAKLSQIYRSLALFEEQHTMLSGKLQCPLDYFSGCFQSYKASFEAKNHLLKLMANIEQVQIILAKKEKQTIMDHWKLEKDFGQVEYFAHIMLFSSLNEKYQEPFTTVYLFYIKPIQDWFLNPSNSQKLLLQNVETFNHSWNEFNFKMLKTLVKESPRKVTIMVSTMHGRWNSILRIILKQ